MSDNAVIAVDVMGGDNSPCASIEGINIFISKLLAKDKNKSNLKILLFGDKRAINQSKVKLSNEALAICEIVHISGVISGECKVTEALKRGEGTSMWEAIKYAATGSAHAVLSSGNTGALMGISKKLFGMLSGISRPAIVGALPTSNGKQVVMLDLGANILCSGTNLAEFSIMGDAYCKAVYGIAEPRVGILNVGSESIKGNSSVQNCSAMLRQYSEAGILNYTGFVEGNSIFNNKVDVLVTDGFSGNIALKVIEGTSKHILNHIKGAMKGSLLAKIGLLFILPAFLKIRKDMDSRRYNGAMLIGLNGISVKAHGSSDGLAMAYSLQTTYRLVKGKINQKIRDEVEVSRLSSYETQD